MPDVKAADVEIAGLDYHRTEAPGTLRSESDQVVDQDIPLRLVCDLIVAARTKAKLQLVSPPKMG